MDECGQFVALDDVGLDEVAAGFQAGGDVAQELGFGGAFRDEVADELAEGGVIRFVRRQVGKVAVVVGDVRQGGGFFAGAVEHLGKRLDAGLLPVRVLLGESEGVRACSRADDEDARVIWQ